jgi:nucleotide-binding universal stress UspA family protein
MNTHEELPVIVGFDASAEARRALSYAHDLAARRQAPLRVVVARGDMYVASAWADEWTRGLATEWVAIAEKELATLGAADVRPEVLDGLPAAVLVQLSAQAACVVVGAGGHGELMGRLLGSVSQHVVRHASSPVVVVREGGEEDGPVVVGVDGSAPSLRALEFALHEAGQRGARVEVIYVPQHPYAWAGAEGAVAVEVLRSFEEKDARMLALIAEVASEHSGVETSARVVEGWPSRVLPKASKAASLVVVGHRGVGGLEGLLLGSVTNAVLHRSRCSVAVVR